MRAKEFTINVPITITINGDEDPVVNAAGQTSPDELDTELQQNPVMISPQQQELELAKAAAGKDSPVIDKLTGQETVGEEPPEQNDIIQQLKALMSR
jgi:hypothetical protein